MSELAVYLCGLRAGRLIRKDNGNLQFRYDHGYDGSAISQVMPVQEHAYPHAACHAVFGGLLVEGEPREALARNLGVSTANDYALLQELGGDCAGAITLLDAETDPPSEPRSRTLDAGQLDELLHELPQRPLAANPGEGIRLSLAGAQPKLPVIVNAGMVSIPLNSAAPTTHILKPEPTRFPGLVDNEAFCLDLARVTGLRSAAATKMMTQSGLAYLQIERYDRDLTTDPILRLHQEDVCQALGRASDRKYQADGGPTVAETVELLRRSSSVPARDLPTLWEALVFNWLIGNCDAHAKNLSLLYDANAPTLAPLYDLVSTVVYPELTSRLAMSVDGATDIDEVDMKAWLSLATNVSFSERFARRTVAELTSRVLDQAARLVVEPPHDNGVARNICDGLRERARRAARLE
jgi:serine/threonine-protein kinase HipA